MTTTVNLQYKLLQESNNFLVELKLSPDELRVVRESVHFGVSAGASGSAAARVIHEQLWEMGQALTKAQASLDAALKEAKNPDAWAQLSKGLGKALDHMEAAEREVLRDCDA